MGMGNIFNTAGVYAKANAEHQGNLNRNQLQSQQLAAGQNALDSQALAGLLFPAMLGGGQQTTPPFMPPGASGTPDLPQQPQMQTPTGMLPQTTPGFTPQTSGAMPSVPASAPQPVAIPGMERYSGIAQQLQGPLGQQYSPAAQFGAVQQIMTAMAPQERMQIQQLIQQGRMDLAQDKMMNMIQLQQMRNDAMLGATGMRVDATDRATQSRADLGGQRIDAQRDIAQGRNDTALQTTGMRTDATMRGQDMREPSVVDGMKFQADQAQREHRALVQAAGFGAATPEQVEAARQKAAQAMEAYQGALKTEDPIDMLSRTMPKKAPKNATGKETKTSTTVAPAAGGAVTVISPDGVAGTIPADQLDAALKAGYKRN